MSVSPSGVIAVIKARLAAALAAAAAVRTVLGAADAAAAAALITTGETIDPTLPEATHLELRDADDGYRHEEVGLGTYLGHGAVVVRAVLLIPTAYRATTQTENARVWLDNQAGALLAALQTVGAGTDVSGVRLYFTVSQPGRAAFLDPAGNVSNTNLYENGLVDYRLEW